MPGLLTVEPVHPGLLGQVLCPHPLGPTLPAHVMGELEDVLQGRHPKVPDPLQQPVQHVDGGTGIVQGTVVR